MKCRFRGPFADREKKRLEQAVTRYEHTKTTTSTASSWSFVHFKTPYKGSLYWGVRADDGYMVKARTAQGLAGAVDSAREESLRRHSRALRQAGRAVSRSIQSAAARE